MADDSETKKEVETKRTVHTYPLIRESNNAGIVNKNIDLDILDLDLDLPVTRQAQLLEGMVINI